VKKEKGGERFENRVPVRINKYTLRIFALWCVYLYTSVVVPVLHDIHNNIYERLPTKYICSITIGSCTLKEKVIYLYLFYLYMCTQVHLLVHMHR
jgi:hypothetical protein